MSIDPKKFGLSDSLVNAVNEALKGDQHKIDANKNGKIDANDFKKLRGEETPGKGEKHNYKHDMMKSEVADGNKANFKQNMKEEAEQIDELSKATMGSYIKKASHDVATKSAATGRYADRANTVKDQMKKGDYSNYQQGKKDDATADKMFGKSWKRRAGIAKAVDKMTKEEVEQVDELSKATLGSYVTKASDKAATHTGAAAHYGSGGTGNNPAKMAVHQAIATKRKAGIQKAVDKLTKEEVEQVNETVETTHENPLVTVHDKNGLHTHANLSTANKIFNTNVKHTDVHKGAVTVTSGHKDKNKLKFAISKHHAAKVRKVTKEEVVDEAAVAGTNVAADMDARKTEIQRRIAAKQASMQLAKSNKRISGSPVKESKCSCGEAKESKMTCEVHGDNKGLKGGKEPIIMNPPLKEASDLPKAVVTKGHEIAKSLIKHRSKVKEPYAVGMAAAKKSAGIKD
jgi:hypothetical protein